MKKITTIILSIVILGGFLVLGLGLSPWIADRYMEYASYEPLSEDEEVLFSMSCEDCIGPEVDLMLIEKQDIFREERSDNKPPSAATER